GRARPSLPAAIVGFAAVATRRKRRRARHDPRRGLRRHGHPLHRRARRGRRAAGSRAEPRAFLGGRLEREGAESPAPLESGERLRDQFVPEGGQVKRLILAAAVVAVALSVPAAFAGGKGLPTTIGPGEGSLYLVAWE